MQPNTFTNVAKVRLLHKVVHGAVVTCKEM